MKKEQQILTVHKSRPMKKFEQSLSITGKAVLNRSSKIQGLDVSRLFRWSTVPHPKRSLRSNQLKRMEKYTERIHCISKDSKSVSLVQLCGSSLSPSLQDGPWAPHVWLQLVGIPYQYVSASLADHPTWQVWTIGLHQKSILWNCFDAFMFGIQHAANPSAYSKVNWSPTINLPFASCEP